MATRKRTDTLFVRCSAALAIVPGAKEAIEVRVWIVGSVLEGAGQGRVLGLRSVLIWSGCSRVHETTPKGDDGVHSPAIGEE